MINSFHEIIESRNFLSTQPNFTRVKYMKDSNPHTPRQVLQPTVIPPTPGRVVWYYPAAVEFGLNVDWLKQDESSPLAAIVVYIHSDRLVNLAVFDAIGKVHPRSSVILKQEGDEIDKKASYCTWMPYQLGQAKKHS